MMNRRSVMALLCGLPLLVALTSAQGPRKEELDGVRNFTNVSPTIACAGATETRVMPELARRGYKAIINLRQSTETGAAIDESRLAAEAAGIKFIHLPFNGQSPEASVVDRFLQAAADPANQPIFIHCASANRVSAMMLAKRILSDGWTEERALEEANVIGPPSAALRDFALQYVAERKK